MDENTPHFRAGTVVLAGRPNAGKSSLVNRLVGAKVSIVSDKPQTTRNAIRSVLNGPSYQIVFVDTPGIHEAKSKLGTTLVHAAAESMDSADLVCYIVEAGDRKVGGEDEEILSILSEVDSPVLLVVNKSDLAGRGDGLTPVRDLYGERIPSLAGAVAVSARTGQGLDALVERMMAFLPEGPPLYDEDIFVDRPEKFLASEIIREKVLLLSHQEVPHSAAVEVEDYKSPEEYPERKVLYIRATIYVEREGQRRILLGDKGAGIRGIGRLSRLELEEFTGHRVYLDLWIKVRPGWKQSEADLRRLGIREG